MILGNKSAILAKIESVYGTDPTPTESANALIVYNPTFEVLGNQRARAVPLPHFGQIKGVNVGDGLKLNFTTELKYSGTAGTASRYDPLLRACNLTVVNTPATSDVYTPNSTLAGESVTLWFYTGGVLHKLNGCAGTFKINLKAGEIWTIDWEFTGLYADNAADTVQPALTHESVAPVIVKSMGFTYNAVSLVIEELMLDIGNTVSPQKSANGANNGIARYFVSQRNSKGTMNPEAEALSTINFWDHYDNTTASNIVVNPSGLSAGQDIELAVTGCVLEPPKYGTRENVLTHEISFNINPTITTGNNEIVITMK